MDDSSCIVKGEFPPAIIVKAMIYKLGLAMVGLAAALDPDMTRTFEEMIAGGDGSLLHTRIVLPKVRRFYHFSY